VHTAKDRDVAEVAEGHERSVGAGVTYAGEEGCCMVGFSRPVPDTADDGCLDRKPAIQLGRSSRATAVAKGGWNAAGTATAKWHERRASPIGGWAEPRGAAGRGAAMARLRVCAERSRLTRSAQTDGRAFLSHIRRSVWTKPPYG
jgi:hypothetical protein